MYVVGVDNAGEERFAAAFPGGTEIFPSVIGILNRVPDGSTVIIERDPYTSNAKGKRDEKNRAYEEHAKARDIATISMGTRVTERYRPIGSKKTDRSQREKHFKELSKEERKEARDTMKAERQQDHVHDAEAIRAAYLSGKHATRVWPGRKRLPRELFMAMTCEFRKTRYDKELLKQIKKVIKACLTPEELKAFAIGSAWAESLIAGLYYAANKATNRHEYMALLGDYAQGKNCYLRALIVRRKFRAGGSEEVRRLTVRACRKVRLPLRELGASLERNLLRHRDPERLQPEDRGSKTLHCTPDLTVDVGRGQGGWEDACLDATRSFSAFLSCNRVPCRN